jgi:hypothetical protein
MDNDRYKTTRAASGAARANPEAGRLRRLHLSVRGGVVPPPGVVMMAAAHKADAVHTTDMSAQALPATAQHIKRTIS